MLLLTDIAFKPMTLSLCKNIRQKNPPVSGKNDSQSRVSFAKILK